MQKKANFYRHSLSAVDHLVQQRIGERGIVQFIMAPSPEAVQVDEDVLAELPLVFKGQFSDQSQSLGIIDVHVEDRCVYALGKVGGVSAAATPLAGSGETHLIIDDHVNRSPHIELWSTGHDEHLLVDSLADKCGVSVQLNVQNAGGKGFLCIITKRSVAGCLLL